MVESTRGINLSSESWHVFDDCYGTSEEKEFLAFIAEHRDKILEVFGEFFIIRNEKAVKIFEYNTDRAVEPDYILIMRRKREDTPLCRQVFIEPKGSDRLTEEAWKSEFLGSIVFDAPNAGMLALEPH